MFGSVIVIAGGVKYPCPGSQILICEIFPSTTVGLASALILVLEPSPVGAAKVILGSISYAVVLSNNDNIDSPSTWSQPAVPSETVHTVATFVPELYVSM